MVLDAGERSGKAFYRNFLKEHKFENVGGAKESEGHFKYGIVCPVSRTKTGTTFAGGKNTWRDGYAMWLEA